MRNLKTLKSTEAGQEESSACGVILCADSNFVRAQESADAYAIQTIGSVVVRAIQRKRVSLFCDLIYCRFF